MAASVEDINKKTVSSMAQKLASRRRPRGNACTIYKVPDKIRKEDPEAYEPQIVSIGPIHHGKPKLLPMEHTKWQFLHSLIGRHESNSLDNYVNAVSNPTLVQQITKCDSEQVIGANGGNSFVEMMVLDGCFIIEFMLKSRSGEPMGELDFVDSNHELVKNDLLLIENQIPFSVLQVLYDSCYFRPDHWPIRFIDLAEIICLSMDDECIIDDPIRRTLVPGDIHHILHLYHICLRPIPCLRPTPTVKRDVLPKIKHMTLELFFLALSFLFKDLPHAGFSVAASAAKLYQSGIRFEPNKRATSMLDVTFRVADGVTKIPLLTVKASSMSRFRNLVALEEYRPDNGKPVTAFVVLMNTLIDTSVDVTCLEWCGVLRSQLYDKEEVVRIFKTLGKTVSLGDSHDHMELLKLLYDVNNFRDSRHRFFEIIGLREFTRPEVFLTILGLYLSIMQTVMSVLTYVRHPKSK